MILAISSATHCKTLIQSATLVRNSHPPPLIGDVQPPSLDSSPKTVSGCGWSTMDWLGVGFILVCCVAALYAKPDLKLLKVGAVCFHST